MMASSCRSDPYVVRLRGLLEERVQQMQDLAHEVEMLREEIALRVAAITERDQAESSSRLDDEIISDDEQPPPRGSLPDTAPDAARDHYLSDADSFFGTSAAAGTGAAGGEERLETNFKVLCQRSYADNERRSREPRDGQQQLLDLIIKGDDGIITAATGSGKFAAVELWMCEQLRKAAQERKKLLLVSPLAVLVLQQVADLNKLRPGRALSTLSKEEAVSAHHEDDGQAGAHEEPGVEAARDDGQAGASTTPTITISSLAYTPTGDLEQQILDRSEEAPLVIVATPEKVQVASFRRAVAQLHADGGFAGNLIDEVDVIWADGKWRRAIHELADNVKYIANARADGIPPFK